MCFIELKHFNMFGSFPLKILAINFFKYLICSIKKIMNYIVALSNVRRGGKGSPNALCRGDEGEGSKTIKLLY